MKSAPGCASSCCWAGCQNNFCWWQEVFALLCCKGLNWASFMLDIENDDGHSSQKWEDALVNSAFKKAGTVLVSLLSKRRSTESHTAHRQQHLKRPQTLERICLQPGQAVVHQCSTNPIIFFPLPSFLFLHPSFSSPPPLTLTCQPRLPKCTKTTGSFHTGECLVLGPVPNISDCWSLCGN